ncbi:FmdB family zinc ribbon protein [Actinokineospora sp. 24-640]
MPTYQYACTACEHRFEAVQKFTDASLTECPSCAGKLRKLYGSVGVVFKGSGFYRTDSRSGGKGTVPAAESASSGSGDAAKPAAAESTESSSSSSAASTPSTSSSSTSSTSTSSAAKAS